MPKRIENLRTKLEQSGYEYKKRDHKTDTHVFKKKGGAKRVYLTTKQVVTDLYVIAILEQIGLSRDEILQFLRDCDA